MAQPLDRLRRAGQAADAAPHCLALAAHRVAAAGRAFVGEDKGRRVRRPVFQHWTQYLRDHIAGALQDHGIAHAHILAGDLVLIMQGGAADHDAADIHRLQIGDRGQGAGAADLDFDVEDPGLCLLGREFMGNRPARRAADHAEALLQGDGIDLIDHAVNIVGQAGSLSRDLGMIGDQRVRRIERLP